MKTIISLVVVLLCLHCPLLVSSENQNENDDAFDAEAVIMKRQDVELLPPGSNAPCVRNFTVPLRNRFCPNDVGTATFELRPNGRVRLTISLIPTLRLQRAFLHFDDSNPSNNFMNYDFRFTTNTFTTEPICRNNRKIRVRIALAVTVVRVNDDSNESVTAWATVGERSLPPGVTFTPFGGNRFAGFFTVVFCECQGTPLPPCCPSPVGFQFQCGSREGFVKCAGIDIGNSPRFCFCGFTQVVPNASMRNLTCFASRDVCPPAGPNCNANADCPRGQGCQLESCCVDANGRRRNICNNFCTTEFPNATACA